MSLYLKKFVSYKKFVENVAKKEGMKENNTGKKKEEEHSCSDVKLEQNDRVYKERKKGKLKSNGDVLLKWLEREIVCTWESLSAVQL